MFARIARFELRFQLTGATFWVIAAVFFLLSFGAVATPNIQIGAGGNVHKNAPFAIGIAHLVFSLFFMLGTTAFVAGVVVRDDETGFGPIIRSTRITKADYLFGRFLGAFLVAALVFLAVPAGFLAGAQMPWIDQETLGPTNLGWYAYAYLWLALPNILLTASIFFALATTTRSMMATYVGVVAFLVVYVILNNTLGRQPQFETLRAYVEPFGLGAYGKATQYWTPAERNSRLPAIDGIFLANRLIWFGVSLAALAVAYATFRFDARGRRERRREKLAETAPPAPAAAVAPVAMPRFGAATALAQFGLRTRFEVRQVVRSVAFPILLVLGFLNALAALFNTELLYGTPVLPVTRVVITILSGSFSLVAIIVATYYSGELVWRERDRRIAEIIDAAAVPSWVLLAGKAVALGVVMLAVLAVGVAGGIGFQLFKGVHQLEPAKYLLWYLIPTTIDWTLVGLLGLFVQTLAPNKYVGWVVMVLYLIATLTLSSLGFGSDLYNYAGSPSVPLSDMNGLGRFWIGASWFRLYWAAFALMLMVAAQLLWRRGTDVSLRRRLRRVPARLHGAAGLVGGVALAVFVATGAWAFYNTHVLNSYRTGRMEERETAALEQALLRYERVPQPSVTAVRMAVDLHPAQLTATVRGEYALVNRTPAPLAEVHVRMPDDETRLTSVSIPGARLVRSWPRFHYSIYRFATPLAPGAAARLAFTAERGTKGFRDASPDTRLVGNGTFLSNFELAPRIGMSRQGLLQDRATRRRYGLPPELRTARLEDMRATARNYIGADWVTSDITLSTDADQVPVAPGSKVSDTTAGGRRTARFVTTAPILDFWSVQSARYREAHRLHRGIDLAVYYDPRHGANVQRMLNAFQAGLDHYQPAYGPYQFRYARIVEFPAYATYAQAFAGTMPYSEGIGFIADLSGKERIDYVTYVAAHELAHQWWAHQVIGADMQGATMLSETLAQYSALMVMERLYGPDQIRRFLKYELDRYLRDRSTEAVEEVALERVENQQYIHYRKGSLVMYRLKDALGEARVDAALRRFLDRFRFKGPPYPRSLDLVAEFRRGATPAENALITDLFERITLYDLKATAPVATKRADGRWDVAVTVDAHKFYAGGKGEEKEAPLAEPIDVGLFAALPGRGAFAAKDVVLLGRQPIRSGRQVIRLIAARKPAYAGIDPYNKFIDRDSEDNLVAVP